MKTDTSQKIIEIIEKNGDIRVVELVDELKISPQALHRQLKKLLEQEKIIKLGKPPKVIYRLAPIGKKYVFPEITDSKESFLNENFLYISPDGKKLVGKEAFQNWVVSRKFNKQYLSLVDEYMHTLEKWQKYFHAKTYLDATEKLKSTFNTIELDGLYYAQFYSIPKFGKTKLGHLVSLGKSGQNIEAIRELAKDTLNIIQSIIKEKKIDTLAWTPHSIPRKLSFIKELKRFLNLSYPEIKLAKAFVDGQPVAQKTLKKLEDRILNAKNTIYIDQKKTKSNTVLLIDDAVGSGATLNETAKKLKKECSAKKVYGFAIVGSLKGFDVIEDI